MAETKAEQGITSITKQQDETTINKRDSHKVPTQSQHEEAEISMYRVPKRPGLEGKRFAVRINDDSLRDLNVPRGHIVIALKSTEIHLGHLHVLDVFDMGIVVRRIELNGEGKFCLRNVNREEPFEHVVSREEFHVIGHVFDLNPEGLT